ncbi:MAG TPA: MBL fold metallo-hydrolase, partial [Pseudohongiella sp.]|nr:MBL fold metallo-hydrolase [Pseudohongiella sp.]
ALAGLGNAQNTSPAPGVVSTRTHIFTPVADGVYHVVGTGAVNVMSNAMLIEGANDLLLVDSHVTPNAGLALIDAVKNVSNKPVRYLVNTHYHFDHAHGNQVFPPEVEIIGHTYTRKKLSGELGNVLEESTFISFTENVPAEIETLKETLRINADPSRRQEWETRLSVAEAHLKSLGEIVPTPPNITIEDKMTIYQAVNGGGREIQILHLGRGHTGGDVVVFLPEEKIVFTGDLMVPGLPYMGDAHVDEWPDTLEKLKQLDFEKLLPGHGPVVEGKDRIDLLQAYLRDLWARTADLKRQGMSADQAALEVDLSAHPFRQTFTASPDGRGADVRAVRRIYALLDER